jgi:hypothetical protein
VGRPWEINEASQDCQSGAGDDQINIEIPPPRDKASQQATDHRTEDAAQIPDSSLYLDVPRELTMILGIVEVVDGFDARKAEVACS